MSNLLFPLAALGAYINKRSPYDSVVVDEAIAGNELRSSWWAAQRTKYEIAFDVVRSDTRQDYQQLVSFFKRHRGQLDSFRLLDVEDNTVSNHGFGLGDGSTTSFQLQRRDVGNVYDDYGGLCAEQPYSRTNLCQQSQTIDNAAWTKNASSVTANATAAPDLTATGDKLVEAASTALHDVVSNTYSVVIGQTVVFSVFAKAAQRTVLALGNGASHVANFDLSAGAVLNSTGCTPTITAAGAGWFRCSIAFSSTVTGTDALILYINGNSSYLGDGSSGLYAWGAQIELPSISTTLLPSRYIATTSATVTVNPVFWPGYTDGFAPITELNGPPTIAVNGVAKALGTDYTLPGSGAVNFTSAPASNAILSWSGSYWIRCRFLDAQHDLDRVVAGMWSSKKVNLVST